ncbi:hypothetical protein, partial [uncultured Gilliamella sp.]|uniref:hypothetical protein n=1 Tax=uncultured Gilliamella sp. TaxID=1193505 RepID=UPI0025D70117
NPIYYKCCWQKGKVYFYQKKPFFEPFFNLLIFKYFILSKKKGLVMGWILVFKNPVPQIFLFFEFRTFCAFVAIPIRRLRPSKEGLRELSLSIHAATTQVVTM